MDNVLVGRNSYFVHALMSWVHFELFILRRWAVEGGMYSSHSHYDFATYVNGHRGFFDKTLHGILALKIKSRSSIFVCKSFSIIGLGTVVHSMLVSLGTQRDVFLSRFYLSLLFDFIWRIKDCFYLTWNFISKEDGSFCNAQEFVRLNFGLISWGVWYFEF